MHDEYLLKTIISVAVAFSCDFISIIDNALFSFSGAIKSVYAPEPFDVGRILHVDVISENQHIILSTTGPIDPGIVSLSHSHLI